MAGNDNVWGNRFFSGHKEENYTFSDVVTVSSVQAGILNPLESLSQKVDRMNEVASTAGSEKAALFLTACKETVCHAVKAAPINSQITASALDSQAMTIPKR